MELMMPNLGFFIMVVVLTGAFTVVYIRRILQHGNPFLALQEAWHSYFPK